MTKYIRTLMAPLALSCAIVLGACGGSDASADSALNRDLDLANRDTTVPVPSDVPGGKAKAPTTPRPTSPSTPTTPRPAPTTPRGNVVTPGAGAAAERTGTVSSGTTINLASSEKVCTNTHPAGSTFTATVSEDVVGSNGVKIPAGSRVTVRVTSAKRSENVRDQATIGLAVTQVMVGGKTYPIQSDIRSAQVEQGERTGKDAQKVAIGAAIGAGIGQILGKDTKGTVIGAASGAAVGTAIAMGTGNVEGCIPAGGKITIALTAPATIGTGN
jgi:hypothetical protein